MFDNKKCLHKIYKQGNKMLCLTSLYKKEQDEQTCELWKKSRSGRKLKPSNKLIGFSLDVLLWNKSFVLDELSKTLLNKFGR